MTETEAQIDADEMAMSEVEYIAEQLRELADELEDKGGVTKFNSRRERGVHYEGSDSLMIEACDVKHEICFFLDTPEQTVVDLTITEHDRN